MNRKKVRVNKTLNLLKVLGYSPELSIDDDAEFDMVDDTIILKGSSVEVQIDSRSGDAVAVNRSHGTGKSFCQYSWDIDNYKQLAAAVAEAMAGKSNKGWDARRKNLK